MNIFGKLLILFVALLVYAGGSQIIASEKTVMTQDQVDKLLSSGNFRCVKNKSEIPEAWAKGMTLDGMSDIGGPFEAGCTGNLPHQRMLAAAVSEPYAILVSENGGYAHYAAFTVFKNMDGAVLSVYSENMNMQRVPEVLQKLKK